MIQKITEIEKELTDHNHDEYITTPEFNKLSTDVFKARLAQANLITKADFYAKKRWCTKLFSISANVKIF